MEFRLIAEYFEKIEKISSRLKMTELLTELFEKSEKKEFDKLIYLCQGKLGPSYTGLEIGMGEKFVIEAIARASGYSREKVEDEFKKKGDLGLVAEKYMGERKQSSLFSQKLELGKVFENYEKIAKAEGKGSQDKKILLLGELLNSSSSIEAKYIVRVPLGKLRLGVGDPSLIDAMAGVIRKCEKEKIEEKELDEKEKKKEIEKERKEQIKVKEEIEAKYNIYSDLGKVLKLVFEKGMEGLEEIEMEVGVPIRGAAGERLSSGQEIIDKIGKCFCEAKYDGFRMQVHKDGNKVRIFSRNEEEITDMFPEIVENVRKYIKEKKVIFEGEALAYNEEKGEFYPFQITIQRKRKYDIELKAKELPLKLFVFDCIYLGKDISRLSFRERREILEKIIEKNKEIMPSYGKLLNSGEEIEEFFDEMMEKGLEGVMAKDLEAPYTAGARKFAWIKLKRSYKGGMDDSLDVCVIGYFKGKGQRTKFGLGALLTAIYSRKDDKFMSVAKVGSGLKEEDMEMFEKLLSKIKLERKDSRVESKIEPDIWVEPKYVIEVIADEITKSPMHTADGLGLRFPRFVKIRSDKKVEDSTSLKELREMFEKQKRVSYDE